MFFFGCDSVNNGIMDNQWKHIETMMVQKNTQRPQAKLHSLTFAFYCWICLSPERGHRCWTQALWCGYGFKRAFRWRESSVWQTIWKLPSNSWKIAKINMVKKSYLQRMKNNTKKTLPWPFPLTSCTTRHSQYFPIISQKSRSFQTVSYHSKQVQIITKRNHNDSKKSVLCILYK